MKKKSPGVQLKEAEERAKARMFVKLGDLRECPKCKVPKPITRIGKLGIVGEGYYARLLLDCTHIFTEPWVEGIHVSSTEAEIALQPAIASLEWQLGHMCMVVSTYKEEVQQSRKRLGVLWASLENIYMVAKREARKAGDPVRVKETWGHVLRFCEEAGCTSSLLQKPTDETTGTADDAIPDAEIPVIHQYLRKKKK